MRFSARGLAHEDRFGREQLVTIADAALQLTSLVIVEPATHGNEINTSYLMAGVGEPIGQSRVVGQKQKATGGEIEATDRDDVSLEVREEVVNRRSTFWIVARGDDAAWLM